jgi:hypothetical protein
MGLGCGSISHVKGSLTFFAFLVEFSLVVFRSLLLLQVHKLSLLYPVMMGCTKETKLQTIKTIAHMSAVDRGLEGSTGEGAQRTEM